MAVTKVMPSAICILAVTDSEPLITFPLLSSFVIGVAFSTSVPSLASNAGINLFKSIPLANCAL